MVYKYKNTITISAGSGSINTLPLHGICRYIYISPATQTTIYQVTITDDDDYVVKNYDSKYFKGLIRDFTPFITQGIYTVSISNATVNEEFSIKLLVEEL